MRWYVDRLIDPMPIGRTRPLIADCVAIGPDDEAIEHRTMVIKTLGLPEITDSGLFAEYFGSLLAIEFGIDAAQPELVSLDADLLNTSAESLERWRLRPRAGLAVGLDYRPAMLPLNSLRPIRGRPELDDAALIYAFDLLTQNPDRRTDNHNCATRRGRLVAYDFEMAFSFLLPIVGGAAEPWRVSALPFRTEHLFWPALRDGMAWADWAPAVAAVVAVDDRVEQLVEFLPEHWRLSGRSVRDHLHTVRQNIEAFHDELQRSLT
jgi:hypothetical protein